MKREKEDILSKAYINKKEMSVLLDISPASITKMFSEKYTPADEIPKIRSYVFGGKDPKYLTTDVIKWFHLEAFVRQIGTKKASQLSS